MPLYRHLIQTILSLLAIALLAVGTAPKSFSQVSQGCSNFFITSTPACGETIDFGQVPLGSSEATTIDLVGLVAFEFSASIDDQNNAFSVTPLYGTSTFDPFSEANTATLTVQCAPQDVGEISSGLPALLTINAFNPATEELSTETLIYTLTCEGIPVADLSIGKVDNADGSVIAGDPLTYTITVTNNGPNTAEDVFVTDDLGGLQLISADNDCFISDGSLACLPGALAAGDSRVLMYTVQTPTVLSEPITITNTAIVGCDCTAVDTVPGNDMAMATTQVIPLPPPAMADLSITKGDNVDPIVAGNTLTYTITVNNAGPQTAQNVVVTDTLPAGVSFVSTSGCSEDPSGVSTCHLPDILAGSSAQYTISVIVDPTTSSTIANTAVVDSDTADPNLANNEDTENTLVNLLPPPPPEAMADLKIEKTASANSITAGGLLTYTITVTNNGPDTAQNVLVTDTLPNGVQFVSSNIACPQISDGSRLCSLGTLAAGAMAQPIMIMVQTPTTLSGQITNTASVGASTFDNVFDNNTSTITTPVSPPVIEPASADLSLTKSASSLQIMPGDTFDYTLTVFNQGPDTAQGVVLFDVLPQSLNLLSASAGCGGSTIISCDLGNLDAGASIVVGLTVQADADAAGTLTNTASVAAQSTADPNPFSNNTVSFDVSVIETPPPPVTPLSLLPADTLLPSAFVGQPYSVIFSGDGGQPPLALSGIAAPPGLGFAAVAGNQLELSGVPSQAGSFIVTVTLTDSAEPPASIVRDYMLTVGAELDIRPLSLPVTQVGENFITTFMIANGIPPDSFTSSDPLPPGLALNGNSLTGIPNQAGDFSLTIQGSDSASNQGMRNYTLSVLPAGLLVLTDALPNAVVNASYGSQVLALGGVRPYRWRIDSAIPEGLAFSNSGFFSGRPTVAGNFIITVTVQDQAGTEASADLLLTVNPTGLVNLTPEIFPNGLLGAPYSLPILPDGGTPPYDCTLVDGQLPPGLSITGCATTISGIPTAAGVFDFMIQISDSATPPQTLLLSRQIRIAEQPPIPIGEVPVLNPTSTVDVPVPKSAQGSPGPDFRDETLQQIAVDAFGDRYVVGSSYNGSSYDIRLLKFDAMDNLVFDRRFDSGGQDFGFAAAVNPLDQSIYVGGYTLQGAVYQALLLKYDIAGVLLWERRNSNSSPTNTFYDLAVDRSGVYAAGERFGANNFDGLIVKYDHDGVLLWESLRATGDTETGNRVAAVPCVDNPDISCTIIAGGIEGIGGPRGWLARLDPSNGATTLDQVLPTTPVEGLTLAGDDIIVGGLDAATVWRITRVDQAFQQIWTTQYLPGEVLRALSLDREGFIYAVGRGPGNGDDGLLIILDSAGALQSEFRFDTGLDERFSDVVIGPSGHLTVAGERSDPQGTQFLLLNLDNGKAF